MIVPNFLKVGGHKSGTAILNKILDAHPETNISKVKEVNFFINPSKNNHSLIHYSTYYTIGLVISISELRSDFVCHQDEIMELNEFYQ